MEAKLREDSKKRRREERRRNSKDDIGPGVSSHGETSRLFLFNYLLPDLLCNIVHSFDISINFKVFPFKL
ncbi:hypothetical protein QPL65_25615, partial [Escherichia coli]|uniref:hypothetical protein n=1 Tax=Escherichia coli TaxID=562 RepID=UPI00270DFCE0